MPNTPNIALPYPSLSDAPNVPSHIQAVATAVDTQLGGGWTTFSFSTAGSTNFVQSAWTQANGYKAIGNKTVIFRASLIVTSTNGGIGGALVLGPLPFTSSLTQIVSGHIYRNDSTNVPVTCQFNGTQIVKIYTTNAVVSNTVPFAGGWAVSDRLRIQGIVEID